jgi:DNA mismatch repair protein MutL
VGRERGSTLVEIEAARDGLGLIALLGPPRDTVASARLVWTYVAIGPDAVGRWVRDRLLLRAVLDGYASLLPRGRYPVAVLWLRVPAGAIDVNVHPAKLEVRFQRSTAVHQLIVPALRGRLAAALGPAPAPAGEVPVLPIVSAAAAAAVAEAPAAYAAGEGQTEGTIQESLWTPVAGGFASLRFVGQLFDGYLLCEGEGRVVLIDQHAAHERVVFERLRAEQRATAVAVDRLLVPEAVELTVAQAGIVAEHAPALAAAGFEGEPFGERTFLFRTVPRLLRGRDVGTVLRALADELLEHGASAAAERARDAVLATIACHSVVRVGQRLDAPAVHALLRAMDGVEISAHCPHGRPVAAELSRPEVEGLFGR